MKKWLLLTAALLLLAGVALTVTYHLLLSRDFLVARIEASIDSRVQIGGYRLSLFSVPARVVIRDVIITRRDETVSKGVAHDQRPPLSGGEIRIDELRFDLALGELLGRRIKASDLRLRGAHFDMVLNQQGEFNLARRFAAPPDKQRQDDSDQGLNARDSASFVTELERLRIEDASFDLTIEKSGLEIEGRELTLDLSAIRVDPGALEKVNQADLDFSVRLAAFSRDRGRQKYGQIGLDGPARVRLFDPATGRLSPDAEIDFAIHPSSYLSTKARYIVELWSVTEALVKLGLQTRLLPETLGFGRDRVLRATYQGDTLTLRAPLSLTMEDWELVLEGDSWFEFGSEQHESGVSLVAGATVSEFLSTQLRKLVEVAPERLRDRLHEELRAPLFAGDRLTLRLRTSGLLSDPDVARLTRLPEVKEVLKDYAKTRLRDLLIERLGE